MKKILILVFFLALSSCGESVSSSDQSEDSLDQTLHTIAPSDEMMRLAQLQCNEGNRDQGIINMVEPQTGQIISRAVVDC